MNEMNWVKFSHSSNENDRKALKKAKQLEGEKIRNGWQWYEIDNRIRVLVPFGADGKPTEKGMEMIQMQKKLQGIL